MTARRLKVVLTSKLPDPVETRMCELFQTELFLHDGTMPRDVLASALGRAEVLVTTLNDKIDADLLASAGPDLKMIANYGVGVDHIDVEAAVGRGLIVTNTPGVLTEDTAEMTLGLILAVARRIVEGAGIVQRGEFAHWSPTWMLGRRLFGKRLGIVGMGRIGQALARRARAFGLSVHYHNRKRISERIEEELGATYWDSLDQMLARMDVVSVNCPHTPATYHLLSERRLKLLQPHAILVNTARGEVIDEAALVELLRAGKIAGAGLDVYEREPAINPGLLGLENAVLLPHMASSTVEARVEMGERVILNIKTLQDQHRPPDRIIPALL